MSSGLPSAHMDAAQTLASRMSAGSTPGAPLPAVQGGMLPPSMLQGIPIPGLMQPFFVPGGRGAPAPSAAPFMSSFVPSLPLPFFPPVLYAQVAQAQAQAQAAQAAQAAQFLQQASSLATPMFAMQPAQLSSPGPLRRPSMAKQRHCSCCGVTKTPMWRDARGGKYLCNACGIRWRKHRVRCTQCQYVPRKSEGDLKTCPRCDTPLFKGDPPAPTPSALKAGTAGVDARVSPPNSPPPPAIALVQTPDIPNMTDVPTSLPVVTNSPVLVVKSEVAPAVSGAAPAAAPLTAKAAPKAAEPVVEAASN
eukprot:m.279198 g.279198  ORF g.279198 m.279198 type:complete len:306 (+) comp11103_c5_seq1:399-1316(+)